MAGVTVRGLNIGITVMKSTEVLTALYPDSGFQSDSGLSQGGIDSGLHPDSGFQPF